MSEQKWAEATEESLFRIFTIPEQEDSTLAKIEKEVSQTLTVFAR